MLAYTLKRTAVAFLILIVVSALTFSLSHLSTDPAMTIAGETASEEDIEAIRKLYGFDKPVYQQYLLWAGRAVAGDFGESYHYKAPVSEMIAGRIGTTVTLGTAAILFALIVSIPLGTIAAMRPNSLIDGSLYSLRSSDNITHLLVRVDDDHRLRGLVADVAYLG